MVHSAATYRPRVGIWLPAEISLEKILTTKQHQWLFDHCSLEYYFHLGQLKRDGHRLHHLVLRDQDRGDNLSSYFHLAQILVSPDEIQDKIRPLPLPQVPLHVIWSKVSQLQAWQDIPSVKLWYSRDFPSMAVRVINLEGGWCIRASEQPLHLGELPIPEEDRLWSVTTRAGELIALGGDAKNKKLAYLAGTFIKIPKDPLREILQISQPLEGFHFRPYTDGFRLEPGCDSSQIVTYRLEEDSESTYNGNWLVLGVVLAVLLILAVVLAIRICLPSVQEGAFFFVPRDKRRRQK